MTDYQFVGIDVAKDKFDVSLQKEQQVIAQVFPSTTKGFTAFVSWLAQHTLTPWVCMEATGHYSEVLADFLVEQKVRVSVVNPLQIKSFARAKLTRNKNDQLDARIIADYCRIMKPRFFLSRPQTQKEISSLESLLELLKKQHTQLTNQCVSIRGEHAKKLMQTILTQHNKRITSIEKKIEDIIKDTPALTEQVGFMTSIKGVGKLTAHKIIAYMPAVEAFSSAKQFAAFMGLTPKQHQSGKLQGKTTLSRIGDARLRKALYMAALSAKRFNASLQPFIARLEQRNKAPKSIICAVMRKLAHLIFGVLKHKTLFDPAFASIA